MRLGTGGKSGVKIWDYMRLSCMNGILRCVKSFSYIMDLQRISINSFCVNSL